MIQNLLILLFSLLGYQNTPEYQVNFQPLPDTVFTRVMFYNTENLFDTYNDSLKSDDDYTPGGNLHWTYNRYLTKLNNISKVILSAGRFSPPDIIGVCEIENKRVIQDLLYKTPLEKFNYRFVHEDSPDERGIDVAFIYNPSLIHVIQHAAIKVSGKELITRDILYVKALIGTDTCHFFINHWPSRSSGQLETEQNRILAAGILRNRVDSVFMQNKFAYIIIMGDFNDESSDISLSKILRASTNLNTPSNGELYNPFQKPSHTCIEGTLKYNGLWNTFDQILVSGSLLYKKSSFQLKSFSVLQNPYLLEKDDQYNGCKPFRTYAGYKYKGGYSDHLPVNVDLMKVKPQ